MLIGMVAANVFLQLVFVWINARGLRENKLRTVFLNVLATITFTKPGVEAWRVASGAEQQPGAAFDPMLEMIWTKLVKWYLKQYQACAYNATHLSRLIRSLQWPSSAW